ncbi:CUB domain-containing protein 1-like [Carcharodon carcharias]|uniref:CUB domain-containing protein 1-like n=1 Tax=Carcharodon carcharias TaxID=13397 RepID=UPI001B7F4EA0|nr:CUB domain-containing protein 1-like [Carcharodon carcharias]
MGRGGVWLLLLMGWILETGCEMTSVTADDGMTINIKQVPGSLEASDCEICINEGECYKDHKLNPGEVSQFDFNCIDPENSFVIEVQKEVGEDADPEEAVRLPELPNLNRTYIWNIGVPYKVGVHMSFVGNHLQQIDSAACPDSFTYTITGHLRHEATSAVLIGYFCKNGTISNLKAQGKTLIELKVPWYETVVDPGFELTFVPPIGNFGVVDVVLQPGPPAYFMSANWSGGFPNDELMSWNFSVPSHYHATVTVEISTLPKCVKRTVELCNGPPLHEMMTKKYEADFGLTLQNCDTDQTSSEVLTFMFKVELFHYGERFEIKLKEEDGFRVKIKQMREAGGDSSFPFCICKCPDWRSNCSSELLLEPGDHLYICFHFGCNATRDLSIEATKSISCNNTEDCHVTNMGLTLPEALSTLPVSQQTFKWVLEQPPSLTVELASERLKLRQLLPGKTCDGGLMYNMSTFSQDGARSIVGQFCPNGAMEKIQTADHVLLELKTSEGWDPSDLDIRLSFIPRLTEDYIMNVIPDVDSPVLLLTPNWGPGMPNKLTASWNISVPPDHVAELTFVNHSVPHCERSHVVIGIIEQREDATLLGFRETDSLPQSLDSLTHTFWLNVSNCESSSGQLNLMLEVRVLEYEDMTDTIIIAAAVAGGLALLIIIAVIVFCMKRRKRQQHQPNLSIYNPGVNSRMLARRRKFVKGRQDNDSHIYAVIDEDRIYADYFNKPGMLSIPEVDVYRSFNGPIMPPNLPPPRGATSKDASPEAVPMVSNDLYTFSVKKRDVEKSNGEMVTFLGNSEKDSSS